LSISGKIACLFIRDSAIDPFILVEL